MLVCLACYGDRVAALLETATELRLYRKEQETVTPCGVTPAPGTGVLALIDLLAAADVDLLICGGLSGCALSALQQSGVAVAPWWAAWRMTLPGSGPPVACRGLSLCVCRGVVWGIARAGAWAKAAVTARPSR